MAVIQQLFLYQFDSADSLFVEEALQSTEIQVRQFHEPDEPELPANAAQQLVLLLNAGGDHGGTAAKVQAVRERAGPFLPLLVLARAESVTAIAALQGVDDVLAMPLEPELLRLQLAVWMRVSEKVQALGRQVEQLSAMKKFVATNLYKAVSSHGLEQLMIPSRREITVVFVDLRGFTRFSALSEPEEVITVLREYHELVGHAVRAEEGTVERFAGDGVMFYFNAPLEQDEPQLRAARAALMIRNEAKELCEHWKRQRLDLGIGLGMASGYVTIGTVGFEGRMDYAAIGTVTNLAARLCDKAADGQILMAQRLRAKLSKSVQAEQAGILELKGIPRPVKVFALEKMLQGG